MQLRHANRPDADPTEDRVVFDELIDIYRAEASNSERITKTPVKMMEKIRLGFYPSNPHTGYKTTDIAGLLTHDKEVVDEALTIADELRQTKIDGDDFGLACIERAIPAIRAGEWNPDKIPGLHEEREGAHISLTYCIGS